jgi:hypothetical protein
MHGSDAIWSKYGSTISAFLNNPMYAAKTGIPPEKLAALAEQLAGVLTGVRDVSVSASAPAEGADGMLNVAKVVTLTGGAADKCSQIGKLIDTVVAMAPNDEAKKALDVLKFEPDAETIAGVKVSHLTIHLDQAPDVSEDDYRQMQKLFGKEVFVFRIAAVDDKHIVSAFGGGAERFEKLIALVKSGGSPLSENAGIKKAAALLESNRTAEGYLAVDTLLKTIERFGKATGEANPIPFEIPKLDAPVAMVTHPAGETGFQIDIAIPMGLISAAKDTAASFQGGGQPPQEPGAPSPSSDTGSSGESGPTGSN